MKIHLRPTRCVFSVTLIRAERCIPSRVAQCLPEKSSGVDPDLSVSYTMKCMCPSAPVTITSIQIRMASGDGATM